MNNEQPDNSALTIESCIATCTNLGYQVAGLEYADQCFCDDELRNGAVLAASDSTCSMACSGSSAEVCGGPNLVSVYSSGNFTAYPVPTIQKTGLPGQWQYQGCLQ
jgi:WSC domain